MRVKPSPRAIYRRCPVTQRNPQDTRQIVQSTWSFRPEDRAVWTRSGIVPSPPPWHTSPCQFTDFQRGSRSIPSNYAYFFGSSAECVGEKCGDSRPVGASVKKSSSCGLCRAGSQPLENRVFHRSHSSGGWVWDKRDLGNRLPPDSDAGKDARARSGNHRWICTRWRPRNRKPPTDSSEEANVQAMCKGWTVLGCGAEREDV
jgi:hypothetical protein